MYVGIGYSELPDTREAGRQAAREALSQGNASRPCDLVLLFATAPHDARTLRDTVREELGASVPVVGGGAVGAICGDRFGYAGDQVVLAALWLEETRCDVYTEGGLNEGEHAVGLRLGRQLAAAGVGRDDAVLLLYHAIDGTATDRVRLLMATPLLEGLEEGLGFLPNLVGAGMQGDYACSRVMQWTGEEVTEHHAAALVFRGDIRLDSIIMHGCRPATGYYTVTRAEGQTILEINGQPALPFMANLMQGAVLPEHFPFFLIFGVNKGQKWGAFDENSYASRLCLGIDTERNGIVMFEPDMVAGTEFQIMYRSFELDYMVPRMEDVFSRLRGRKPVLALYIDCAGRAAGYGGVDMEDAVVVQNTIAGRAPLLGLYTGVEIASVMGRPRGLDWTGVFCIFSIPE